MKRRLLSSLFPWGCGCLLLVAARVASGAAEPAVEPATEDPVHTELRAFRAEVVDAINQQDLDRLLSHLTDDVVVTWQNAEISRGPQEVREYYERMMKSDEPIVASATINPQPDQLTKIVGDLGMAHGTSQDHFILTDGREFTVNSVWSATIVKQDDGWKISSFHASANMFDNPVLWIAVRQASLWAGGAALLVGALLGALIVWFLKRKSGAAHGVA